MHERLIIDPTLVNKTIPTLRLKPDLVGKRLYFWEGGTADDLAILIYNKEADTLRTYVQKTKDSGFEPVPQRIKDEIIELSKPNTLNENSFIYNMEGKELLYNLTTSEQIIWFFSYPPQKITNNKHYLVIWDELNPNGKTTTQKIFRLVQDVDNLVALSTFFNKSSSFIIASKEPTDTGLNLGFLLTARTFGLPLKTSGNTFLKQYCERYKRGDNKLDPERLHENFQNIALGAIEEEEEKKNSKKELIGGRERTNLQNFSLVKILDDGMPFIDEAEIDLNGHSQKGFPVKISHAHISGGFLVLYADEEMKDYFDDLLTFRTIFDYDRVILIALDDTEYYEESRGWLH